jgi:hypothetical protein
MAVVTGILTDVATGLRDVYETFDAATRHQNTQYNTTNKNCNVGRYDLKVHYTLPITGNFLSALGSLKYSAMDVGKK